MIVGVGIDLVEIARVDTMFDGKGDRMLERLFTAGEVAYAKARVRPAMHLAARLAAKEAAFKALSGSDEARLIGWREVEVIPHENSAPTLAFHGRAQARSAELGVERVWVSLTHTDSNAAAVVILEKG
jgi:holo-[acyl-carrier protein] synthase